MAPQVFETQLGGRTLTIETGKLAMLAGGSVTVRFGDTMVLGTANRSEPRPGLDFFPLTVDYQEKIYAAGGFGKIIYSEGEYCHTRKPGSPPIASYREWRRNGCPMWYPTHATAYYVGVTHGSFADVSCKGILPLDDSKRVPDVTSTEGAPAAHTASVFCRVGDRSTEHRRPDR